MQYVLWRSITTISLLLPYIIHTRTIYNETGVPLYIAGYHAGQHAERKTAVLSVEPNKSVSIEVPDTDFFSTKKRYIVAARQENDLAETLSLPQLKSFPHKDLGTFASRGASLVGKSDFYLVEKDNRLKMYNELEHSQLVQWGKQLTEKAKKEIVGKLVNKEELPAVKNNLHKTEVARVRIGNTLVHEEKEYLTKRMPKVKQALEKLIGKNLEGKKIPKIALILSGGGNRSMFASAGYTQGAREIGLLDAVTYIASLSGSTWFLGSWLASGQSDIAIFNQNLIQKMQKGIIAFTQHEIDLIADAFKVKIAYDEPVTMMDVYGALLGNALLSDFGDNRYMIYLSNQSNLIHNGDWAFPIYTAVDGSRQTHQLHHWYEFTPYEVGGAWLGNYVPTWAFGRKFLQGISQTDAPEIPLGFLFGIFGSAFAVDAERIWQEAVKIVEKASVFEDAVRKLILNQIGDHRVTQAEEFNFTAGLPSSPLGDKSKMIFIDAGFAFGLPYQPVSGQRPERAPEILIFIESSENVGKLKENVEAGSTGLRAAAQYAKDNGLKFPPIDQVTPNAIKIYKDENDPTVPLVIWMPLVKDQTKVTSYMQDARFAKLADFEVSQCIKDFCPSINFTYKPEQAQQLISLGQLNMHACKQDIIDAIAWKIEHM
ncbi:MAG TPA: hypothetical protein VGW78_00300 [Candidatus Babeliales bacterium]|jgi:phospholipase A2|nr:hypothetical protein [Candidatus Babeliales bacterium]